MAVSLVAQVFGTDRRTIQRWLERYALEGERGLHRKPGSGRPRILEGLTENKLRSFILQPASDFGYETDLWTVSRVQAIIEDHYGVSVSSNTVWRRLREAGLTYQKPERQYYELDEHARNIWARTEVPRIRRAVLENRAILYFQDEANVSLTAFLGKTWGLRGQTPKVKVTGKRGGVAAMSAISRRGYLLFRLYEKRITSVEVIEFLGQMLNHHKTRHLVVVMDQARPHTSNATTKYIASQRRLHVFYLPKYSPDWNPDEKVWNHLKHQELKAHRAKTKEELKSITKQKLRNMSRDPELIRGIFFRCCVADLFE
jgi:transposase